MIALGPGARRLLLRGLGRRAERHPQGPARGRLCAGPVQGAQAFRLVVFPQLLRVALPGLGNNWMVLLKETSLVSVIALPDLMFWTGRANVVTKEPFLFFGVACLHLSLLLARLRLRHRHCSSVAPIAASPSAGSAAMSWCEFPAALIGNEALHELWLPHRRAGWASRCSSSRSRSCSAASSRFGLALTRIYGGPILSRPRARLHHLLPRHAAALPALPRLLRRAGSSGPFLQDIGLWWFFREAFFCAVFTFTLNTAAYQAEIFRGSLQSVHRGQWEAARALGMRWSTILRQVVAAAGGDRGAAAARQRAGHHGEVVGASPRW